HRLRTRFVCRQVGKADASERTKVGQRHYVECRVPALDLLRGGHELYSMPTLRFGATLRCPPVPPAGSAVLAGVRGHEHCPVAPFTCHNPLAASLVVDMRATDMVDMPEGW